MNSPRPRRYGRGQSLVEVALLLPVLIVIMAAVIDLGRVLDASIVLSSAAQIGARFGSMHPTWYDSIRVRVVDSANSSGMAFTGVFLQGANVAVSSSSVPGASVVITVTYDLPLYFGRVIGVDSIHIVRQAEMMVMVRE